MADRDVELIEGQLSASVMLQDVTWGDATIPCWTAVTRDLRSVGQAEIAICLVRDGDDPLAFPPRILAFFKAVHGLAREGRFVGPGDLSWLGGEDPLGLGPFCGVAYDVSPDFGMSADTLLCGLLLTEPELKMAQVSSTTRVLTQLGNAYRYFPFPYWTDPARASVFDDGDADESILRMFPKLTVADASATLAGSHIRVVVPPSAATVLAMELREGRQLALTLGRDPAVPAILTWRPGQRDAAAINADGADGSLVAGTFVAFVPTSKPDDRVAFQEDGFSAVLGPPSTGRLADVLTSGGSCAVESNGYVLEVSLSEP